jgi:hypothetical protein
MSIEHYVEKIKPFYLLFVILLVAITFFGLGRLSILNSQKTPLKIEYTTESQSATALSALNNKVATSPVINQQNDGEVIASKNGTKYYFPWCGTVKRIKPENQVKFSSTDLARAAGYLPADNCKGLK